MAKLLNTIIHKLTEQQVQELSQFEVVNLGDISPDTANYLKNTPSDREDLKKVAEHLVQLIVNGNFTHVLLPCGSPAFAWEFAQVFPKNVVALFAHSERNSVEAPGFAFADNGDGTYRKVPVVEKKVVFNHVCFF